MAVTTPEILEPGQLLGYVERDFTEIVAGGGPNGADCLRINHATNSNKQSMAQALRTDSHLWPANPATNALSFWIRRRQAFAGTGTQMPNSTAFATTTTTAALPAAAGLIMGLGAANARTMAPSSFPLSWGVFGYNTDDLAFMMQARSGGQGAWYGPKLADLPLDVWTFCVVNIGVFNAEPASFTPASGLWSWYVNALPIATSTPPASSSSGGSYLRVQNVDPTITRFAIGDPTASDAAIRGVGNGPLVELSQVAMHSRELTALEILALYESMLYG